MLQMAVGEMGLNKNDFDELTPKEFFYINLGYQKKIEYELKNHWETARLISFYIGATNSKRIKKVTDIIKFPWEKEPERINKKLNKNEFLNLKSKWEKAIKKP